MFGGGGFAGDAGNQFAGGGFMPSQAPDTGYGGGGGAGSGGKRSANATLRTLTIRQLVRDVGSDPNAEHYMVDGVELSNATVVGKILRVEDRGANVNVFITDGTGELEISHWLQEEAEYAMQSKKAELQPGVYIKAHGHMRQFQGKVGFSGFTVRPITNHNEITYHFLRAIFEHLHLTKGRAGGAAPQGQGMGMPQGGGGFGAPAAGGWGGGAPQQQQQQQPPMGGGAPAYGNTGGGDSLGETIQNIVAACNDEAGMHVETVFNQLGGRYSREQVTNALNSLVSEAHLYNTVDDFHYKSATTA